MKRTGLIILAACLPLPAQAAEGDYLVGGAGVFDAFEFDEETAEGRIELRSGEKLGAGLFGWRFQGIGPMVGFAANTDGGVFGYGGLYADMRVTDNIVFQPSAGLGGYSQGDSAELGGVFQFHLGAEVAYEFDNGDRAGVYVTHISNADIHDRNPGVESVLLTYSISLDRLF